MIFKKYRWMSICFILFALTQQPARAQEVDILLNYTHHESQKYNAKTVALHRAMYKISVGKFFLTNYSDMPISIQLFHSDAPEKPFSTTTIGAERSGYCPIVIGSDWGVRFELGGALSEIFFVLQVTKFVNGEFRMYYNGTEQIKKNASLTDPIQSIQIGQQVWTQKNLNRDRFRNGDRIEPAKSMAEWESANFLGFPAWCYYNFDPANEAIYGKLYNEAAINDPRMLAPRGYHIATYSDWINLLKYYGGENNMKKMIKGGKGWDNVNGNDGLFLADAGGFALKNGTFKYDYTKSSDPKALNRIEMMTNRGVWWAGPSKILVLEEKIDFIDGNKTTIGFPDRSLKSDLYGFSIRCVRD